MEQVKRRLRQLIAAVIGRAEMHYVDASTERLGHALVLRVETGVPQRLAAKKLWCVDRGQLQPFAISCFPLAGGQEARIAGDVASAGAGGRRVIARLRYVYINTLRLPVSPAK
jgi:hypothetical protein